MKSISFTDIIMSSLKMLIFPTSYNAKTGNIIQSYSSRSTCPEKCPLKACGCYAEGYYTRKIWDRCDSPNDTRYVANEEQLRLTLLEATKQHLKGASNNSPVLFRHNVAGDVAIEGTSVIDSSRINILADAVEYVNTLFPDSLKGYTYTHCTINKDAASIIQDAASKGFLINASCETIQEVVQAKALGINTVITSVSPDETKMALKASGIPSAQCPAQTHAGRNCDECRLCSRDRKTTIIFGVHGSASKKATKVIMIKNAEG